MHRSQKAKLWCERDIWYRKEKKYAKEEALKSGNLLDLYDDDGDPLYKTDTDSDDSDSE